MNLCARLGNNGKKVAIICCALVLALAVLYHQRARLGWHKPFGFFQRTKRLFFPADNQIQDPALCLQQSVPSLEGDFDALLLGDSHFSMGRWQGVFPSVRIANRGVAGDCSQCLYHKIDALVSVNAARIFVEIGSADLQKARTKKSMLPNIARVIQTVREKRPQATLYLLAIPPVNEERLADVFASNQQIGGINLALKSMARSLGIEFIDIYPELIGEKGQLREEFTLDGVHLSEVGYQVLYQLLAPYFQATGERG